MKTSAGIVRKYAILIGIAATVVTIVLWAWMSPHYNHGRPDPCQQNLWALGDAVIAYMEENNRQPPASLQVLYDKGYIKDVALFCCPSTGHKPGPTTRIAEWSDYRYAPYPTMWDDHAKANRFDVPILMDKSLRTHLDHVNAFNSWGLPADFDELHLHIVANDNPAVLPDELQAYYAARSVEIAKVKSVLSYSVTTSQPQYGVFHFALRLTNSGTDPVSCEVLANPVNSHSAHYFGGESIDDFSKEHPILLAPKETKTIGYLQLWIFDVLQGGVPIERHMDKAGSSTVCKNEWNLNLQDFNSRFWIQASLVLNVDMGQIKGLTLALTTPPVRYVGDKEVFPKTSAPSSQPTSTQSDASDDEHSNSCSNSCYRMLLRKPHRSADWSMLPEPSSVRELPYLRTYHGRNTQCAKPARHCERKVLVTRL